MTSTIAAIATPAGRGGVGVIRVSGPRALPICQQLLNKPVTEPRRAYFRQFIDPSTANTLDEGLVLYFNAPNSFTGEDVVELQGHGSPVALRLLLQVLYGLGAKPAAPGEFSARAFNNNKIDLAQAEAIADLIDSQSEAAALSAVRSLTGVFSSQVNAVLAAMIELRLYVEAAIDFPEEEVDFLADGLILQRIIALNNQLEQLGSMAKQGKLLRDGMQVVIAGKPNAGKSSLLNALAGSDRAIVTDIAGTTRDVLSETIVLQGVPLVLVDTAGLRASNDVVEQEGVRRATAAMQDADIVLLLMDASATMDVEAHIDELLLPVFGQVPWHKLLLVHNKIDKLAVPARVEVTNELTHIYISAKEQQGLAALQQHMLALAGQQTFEDVCIARSRHVDALRRCQLHVLDAQEQLQVYHAGELVAESLRHGQNALAEITGAFSADDLLGKIFSSFCIGK